MLIPSSVLRGLISHYLISPNGCALTTTVLTTFLRPLTTLDETTCVVYPVLLAVLLLSRDTFALLVSTLVVYIVPVLLFLFHARRPECFCTPMFSDFSSYHMPNYDTPNPLSHSFCLLAVYTCTWEPKTKATLTRKTRIVISRKTVHRPNTNKWRGVQPRRGKFIVASRQEIR